MDHLVVVGKLAGLYTDTHDNKIPVEVEAFVGREEGKPSRVVPAFGEDEEMVAFLAMFQDDLESVRPRLLLVVHKA
jgi:hypothetical protein